MANIIRRSVDEEVKPSFLSYSVKVITDRSLPDVRDGLKPVHRRIMYGMDQGEGKVYRKSARIVGDVMGKYHPHGDSSIYDAMVRFAQNWQMGVPLVDGHGNFGSRDGDGAAAMRYTEARMPKIGELMLDGIKKNVVPFKPNYDGKEKEPVVLPSKFPNLLVNGSSGIAVGMATYILPHNFTESIEGVIAYLKNPKITVEQLKEIMPGPDFPTYGQIIGRDGIDEYFRTGKGSLIVRGTVEIEEINGYQAIVVRTLPYGTRRDKFEEEVREIQKTYDVYKDEKNKNKNNALVNVKKPPKAMDFVMKNMVYKDDTKNCDDTKFRTVILLKKGIKPEVVINHLYKYTCLQSAVSVNNTVLIPRESDGRVSPAQVGVITLIAEYVKHQKKVFLAEYKYELDEAKKNYRHIEGLTKALNDLDRTLKIIRQSDTDEEAINGLIKLLKIEADQALYVMERKIRTISNYEQKDLKAKATLMMDEINRLELLVTNETELNKSIIDHFEKVKSKYPHPRKTDILDEVEEFKVEDTIQNEQIVVTLTKNKLIKATLSHHFKAQKRNGRGVHSMALNETDTISHMEPMMKHDLCLLFTNKGKVYGIKGYEIPENQTNAKGIHLYHLLQGMEDDEEIQSVLPITSLETNNVLIFATKRGKVKSTLVNEYRNIRGSGIVAITLEKGDEVVDVQQVKSEKDIVLFTKQGQSIRFEIDTVKVTKRDTYGVMGIKMKAVDDDVVASILVSPNDNIFTMSEKGFGKRTEEIEYRLQKRGGVGVRAIKINEKTGPLVGALNTKDEDYVGVISSKGLLIKVESEKLTKYNRNAQGTKVIKLTESDAVKCVAKLTAMVEKNE